MDGAVQAGERAAREVTRHTLHTILWLLTEVTFKQLLNLPSLFIHVVASSYCNNNGRGASFLHYIYSADPSLYITWPLL